MDIIFCVFGTLCAIVISIFIWMVYYDYIMRQKMKSLPKLKAYPLIGHSIELIRMTEAERQVWYLQLVNYFQDGLFVHFIGSRPFVHIYKPEFFEIILPSTVNIQKGLQYEKLIPWLGYGLLISTGTQWFHDRKLIGPTFHFSVLDQFATVMTEKAEILTKCLEKEIEKCPGKPIDIFPFAINAALDIICETAMGVDIRAQEVVTEYSMAVQRYVNVTTNSHEYVKLYEKTKGNGFHFVEICNRASKLTVERILQPWYWIDWLYYLMPVGKEYISVLDRLHKFTKQVISKKKVARQLKNSRVETEEDGCDTGKRKGKAFLDLLLDQNEKDDIPLDEDELRAQVDTFMFEGHDTTAVAITWTLFCLGNNLEQQEKVHEELERVFKDGQTPASLKELSQLKYLERVIKETLRLYPSVPTISRKLVEDVKLGDYTIPADTTVVLSILLAHRNPRVWQNPSKFDPDRFLPENLILKHRNPYVYVPFSAGPRNCIGQKFALLEEKSVLTAILRKWRVKSAKEEVSFASTLILRPCEEVFLYFTPKK